LVYPRVWLGLIRSGNLGMEARQAGNASPQGRPRRCRCASWRP
jgi:hypothetical protein